MEKITKFEKLLEEFKTKDFKKNLQAIDKITIDNRFIKESLNFYVKVCDGESKGKPIYIYDRCAHYDYSPVKEEYEMFVVDKNDGLIKKDLEFIMERLEGL